MAAMRILCLVCSAALLALAPPARAGADETEAAREHFRRGQTHYALGEFEQAAAEFKEAYRLRSEPAILFNIAQAMRLLGQLKQAVFYYKQFLVRRPDVANRADVEGMIEGLRLKIAEREQDELSRRTAQAAAIWNPHKDAAGAVADGPAGKAGQQGGPGEQRKGGDLAAAGGAPAGSALASRPTSGVEGGPSMPATVPTEALAAAPADGGVPPMRIAGIAAIGVGVAVEGLAFLFRSSAQSAADELGRKYGSGALTPADTRLKSDMESKGRLATISAIGGAALIAAGAVSFAF